MNEHPAIARVRAYAAERGLALDVRRYGGTTHTAEDAARAIVHRGLLAREVVWAAAGLPDAVFPIAPEDLVRIGGARVVEVAV